MGRFYAKALTKEQSEKIEYIRGEFALLYDSINHCIPEGREKSLYTTKLEEACMWAVKAVSNYEPVDFEEFVPTAEQIVEQMNKINEKLKKEIY